MDSGAVNTTVTTPGGALSSAGSTGGYGTNHDTNAPPTPKPGPQVVEENGRPVRARTADLHRVKVAL
jgi:hypothetical protein